MSQRDISSLLQPMRWAKIVPSPGCPTLYENHFQNPNLGFWLRSASLLLSLEEYLKMNDAKYKYLGEIIPPVSLSLQLSHNQIKLLKVFQYKDLYSKMKIVLFIPYYYTLKIDNFFLDFNILVWMYDIFYNPPKW